MDAHDIPPLASSFAGLAAVARERAVVARTRRRPAPATVTPVANVDAVAPIGDRGDDARRRDKRADTPEIVDRKA